MTSRRLALVLVLVTISTAAAAQPATVQQLLRIERDLDGMCRGSTSLDRSLIDKTCSVRERAAKLLNSLGYCYGKRGQIGADMRWHRCGPGSERMSSLPVPRVRRVGI